MKAEDIEDIYELSPLQQGILFHSLCSPESPLYLVQVVTTIVGPLNEKTFYHSWQHALERNPGLRASFHWQEIDKPLQIVHRGAEIPIETHDWQALDETVRQARLSEYLQADERRNFSLTVAPLMRLALFRINAMEHELVWSYHHLLMDGWSVNLFLSEVAAIYEALSTGRKCALALRPSFRRYVQWLQSCDTKAAETFWRGYLAGKTAPTQLPSPTSSFCRAASTNQSSLKRNQSSPLHVPVEIVARMQKVCRVYRITMNTMILAAWSILLSRYTGEPDVMFGVTVSGRSISLPQADSMIGLFINTVPVRIRVQKGMLIDEWLRTVQNSQSDAQHHTSTPLVQIHQWSSISSNLPLFNSLVVFERYPIAQDFGLTTSGGLQIKPRAGQLDGGAEYPLTLCLAETAAGLRGSLSYDRALFDAAAASRILGNFVTLLESLMKSRKTKVSDLPMLTSSEQRQLLLEWNRSEAIERPHRSLHQLFEDQVELTPEAVALVDAQTDWTYRQLNDAANVLARRLLALGVDQEAVVGVYTRRTASMVAALLAVGKAGLAFLPLDPDYPAERIRFMMDDCRVAVALTEEPLLESLPPSAAKVVVLDGHGQGAKHSQANKPNVLSHPRSLAYILYTSGSSGRPKGIWIEQGSVVALMHWAHETYDADALACVLATTSISYDCSIFELFAPLCWGGTVILARSALQTPPKGVTLLSMVPSVLLQQLRANVLPQTLRAINVGGEFSPRDLAEELVQHKALLSIFHLYGPAECTTYSTCSIVKGNGAHPLSSIGKPIRGTRAYILDSDGSPVPVGVPGELYLSGAGLARGYVRQPALTAEKFVPDPYSPQPGARMYRTGDLARYRANGEIELLGRMDQQVKIRGLRVELGEIEALLQEHEDIADAIVLALEDPAGEKRLVAYFVPRGGRRPLPSDLRGFLRQRLPASIVPSVFLYLEALPRMPNGKADCKALPKPDWERPISANVLAPPRDICEFQLLQIFEDLLGISPIGINDSFFDLGGHSLLGIALVSRVKRVFGKRIPLSSLLGQGTVQHLAEVLRAAPARKSESCLVPIQPKGSDPPLFLVHPGRGSIFCYYELTRHLGDTRSVYGLQSRALDGLATAHSTVEEMAAHYIREMEPVAARSPLLIGGWCMGGVIAFEMAQQCVQKGREVALLAVMDSVLPDGGTGFEEENDVALLANFAEHLHLTWDGATPSREELNAIPAERLLAYVLDQAKAAGSVPSGISLDEASLLFELFKMNCRAERAYTPREYLGKLTLFRAAEPVGDESCARDLGWGKVAAGGVSVHQIPGNHHSMLRDPHVKAFAQHLGSVMKGVPHR